MATGQNLAHIVLSVVATALKTPKKVGGGG